MCNEAVNPASCSPSLGERNEDSKLGGPTGVSPTVVKDTAHRYRTYVAYSGLTDARFAKSAKTRQLRTRLADDDW
jgi:hypothetical protein